MIIIFIEWDFVFCFVQTKERKIIQYAFPARYSTRKILGEVSGDPLTPYGVWAHYILANDHTNSMVFVDGVRVLDQSWGGAGEVGLSVSPLLLFAEEPDVNNLEESPDVSLSNLKIFYKKFSVEEALKLYHDEIRSKWTNVWWWLKCLVHICAT